MKIVGICQVRNEDLYIRNVLANIVDFCDEIIVADNMSTDQTAEVAQVMAEKYPKIRVEKIAKTPAAHDLIRVYANTPTWVFPVDGDEIYDAEGLIIMRRDILAGKYDQYRQIYGNAFHCCEINPERTIASGYMAPPSRTVTKLYNFGALIDWEGPCVEKCHGGRIVFKDGYNEYSNKYIYHDCTWENSPFRVLHMCFVRRSSLDKADCARFHVVDLYASGFINGVLRRMIRYFGLNPRSSYKNEKYRKGEHVARDVASFFVVS